MTTIYELGNMKPTLPENNDFWIAPNAFVIGNVIMKEGTSVWFGTTIRGDNETVTIMDGTNIQENTILHTDLGFPIEIGKNCTIRKRTGRRRLRRQTFNKRIKRKGKRLIRTRSRNGRTRPCLLYTSPSPRDRTRSRMPSSA